MPGGPQPRVLIADDNAAMCTAVSSLLSPNCDVVACVADIAALFDAASRLRPHVVLLDFTLSRELSAFEVCRRLKTMAPEVKVVALTALDDAEVRRAAYEAGFSGFVWKVRAATELWPMIQAVVDGNAGPAQDDRA